jgi:hypothetical protein
MIDRPVEQLTARELFTEAERLTRELSDHLENGFVPRVHNLLRLVRPNPQHIEQVDVEDGVIRSHATLVLESERFTEQLYDKLQRYCEAIDRKVEGIVSGE